MLRLLLQQLSNVLYICVVDKLFSLWNNNTIVHIFWYQRVVEWCWHWFFYRPGEAAREDLERNSCGYASSAIHNSADIRGQSKGSSVDPKILGLGSKLQNHNMNSFRTL